MAKRVIWVCQQCQNWREKRLPKKQWYVILRHGEMSEWSNVPLSKSGKVQAFVGSNPTLSAFGGVS